MPVSLRDAQALAYLANRLRPDWDRHGVERILARVADRDLGEVAVAALIASIQRTDQRTPACIAMDGRHWHVLRPGVRTLSQPTAAAVCPIHLDPRDRCRGCAADRLAGVATPEPAAPASDAVRASLLAQARAAIRATATGPIRSDP